MVARDLTCKGKREFELGYRIQHFLAQQGDDPGDIRRVKTAAWEAVRENIDLGVPTVALCPMSADPRSARDWGLLVGYDEADYLRHSAPRWGIHRQIRRDWARGIRLLRAGLRRTKPVDANSVHVKALQNAIAFANGPTYDPKEVHFQVDAFGFEAYELWREAIESGVADESELAIGIEAPRLFQVFRFILVVLFVMESDSSFGSRFQNSLHQTSIRALRRLR